MTKFGIMCKLILVTSTVGMSMLIISYCLQAYPQTKEITLGTRLVSPIALIIAWTVILILLESMEILVKANIKIQAKAIELQTKVLEKQVECIWLTTENALLRRDDN